jgi:hypothetical protein
MLAKAVGFKQESGLGVLQKATADQDTLQYRSSTAAIKEGLLEVREISEGGSVNHVFVLNKSEFYLFLMDGDILMGAKQNRVVNTSVLLAPRSKTQVPVSCVEQGRWDSVSTFFQGANFTAPSFLRADKAGQVRKSLKANRGHMADQGEIWGRVEEYHARLKVSSATGSLSDVYAQREDMFEKFISAFTLAEKANGAAIFMGKEMLSIDLFNRRDVFGEYFPRLLRGVGAEVFSRPAKKQTLTESEASYWALEFMDEFDGLELEEFPGVGVGVERRFEKNPMTGFELRYQSAMVHLTVLRQEQKRHKTSGSDYHAE